MKDKIKNIRRSITAFLFIYLIITAVPFWVLIYGLGYPMEIFTYFGCIPYLILLITFEG